MRADWSASGVRRYPPLNVDVIRRDHEAKDSVSQRSPSTNDCSKLAYGALRIQDLRHVGARHLRNKGGHPTVIQDVLGHECAISNSASDSSLAGAPQRRTPAPRNGLCTQRWRAT